MRSRRATLKAADLIALCLLAGSFLLIALGEDAKGKYEAIIYLIAGWYGRGLAGYPARRKDE